MGIIDIGKDRLMAWDGTERRRFVRVHLICRIIVHTPQEVTIDTVTDNISEGGLGFTLREKLDISSIVGLEIYKIKKKPIICKGIVRWVNPIGPYHNIDNPLFNTGIQFHQIRAKDKLAIINLIASVSPDRK